MVTPCLAARSPMERNEEVAPLRIPTICACSVLVLASTGVLEGADWRIRGDATQVRISSRHKALGPVRVLVDGGSGMLGLDGKDLSVVGLAAAVPTTRARLISPKDSKLSSAIVLMSRQVPQVRFMSRSIQPLGGGRFAARGEMAMGSISRPTTLTLTLGPAKAVKGRTTRSLRGAGTLRVSELLHGGVGLVERALAFMFQDDIHLNIETTVER